MTCRNIALNENFDYGFAKSRLWKSGTRPLKRGESPPGRNHRRHQRLSNRSDGFDVIAMDVIFDIGPGSGEVPGALQVWPLIQFFLFSFCKRSLICLEGKSMTPCWANTFLFYSSQQLFVPVSCVASGHYQVCCARHGGPRTPSTTTDANLDCAFVENPLSDTDP